MKNSRYLAEFYDERVKSAGDHNFLKQVGHTEGGKPISEEQFGHMTGQLADLLALEQSDAMLDICCGNGIITQRLAAQAGHVTGIDISSELVSVAREYHGAANTEYHVGDALRLDRHDALKGKQFDKFLMHGALQHIRHRDFELLLRGILSLGTKDPVIVFGFVPEAGKQSGFFSTPARKLHHLVLKATGRDVMGTWWKRDWLAAKSLKHGMACEFHEIHPSLAASRYRFDVKIRRQAG